MLSIAAAQDNKIRQEADSYRLGVKREVDFTKAVALYRRAAAAGDGRSMTQIGLMYDLGLGVEKNTAKAIEWFKKGIDAGDGPAARALVMSLEPDAPQRDEYSQKAFDLCKDSASKGDAEAMRCLGSLFEYGVGVEKNEVEAVKWYKLSAEAGSAKGTTDFAYRLEYGIGTKKDFKSAMDFFRKAADGGDDWAMYRLGQFYYQKNPAMSAIWHKKAATRGNADAMAAIGECYLLGHGVSKDLSLGFQWCERGHKAGSLHATANLGTCLNNGWGIRKNQQKALKLFRQAADAGVAIAMANVSTAYEFGRGVDRDPKKAVSWLKKAANAGDVTSMMILGKKYAYGSNEHGIRQDNRESALLFFKASQAGNGQAMGILSAFYWDGRGVPQNRLLAYHWANKGAGLGDFTSKEFLIKQALGNVLDLAEIIGTGVDEVEGAASPDDSHKILTQRYSNERVQEQQRQLLQKKQEASLDSHMDRLRSGR